MKLDYDEISPITNNLCVLVEALDNGMNSYLCMESGFVSNDMLRIGSDMISQYEEIISQLMRDVKHIDKGRGLVWYPTYMQIENFVLYCSGTSTKDLGWEIASIIPLSDEDSKNYPIPGTDGQYFTARVDIDNSEYFVDFTSAMAAMYSSVAKLYNENLETGE